MKRDVFQAVADPTRREILEILARGPQNLVAITGHFKISRPAVAKHLKILVDCGMVEMQRRGRNSDFKAKLAGLRIVMNWTLQFKSFWDRRLDRLGDQLEKE